MEKSEPDPQYVQKLAPKMRVVANGSTEVNALRAEHSAALVVPREIADKVEYKRTQESGPAERAELPADLDRGKIERPPNATVSVFVQLTEDFAQTREEPTGLKGVTARKANLATAEMKVKDVMLLAESDEVAFVEPGQPLVAPTPVVAYGDPGPPSEALRRIPDWRRHRHGEGVLIGLIDVQGFDFAHRDFLDERGKTRFVRIWDQGGDTRPAPESFGYGSELDGREHLDKAIRKAPQVGLPPQELEPQSQMVEGSHGTHVASIAAGNRGICRNAQIAAVLIDIPETDAERRLSFYDSSRIAHAVDYLLDVAQELRLPVSINISLGTNGHAHDDSSPVSRWIDAALVRDGRSVCVAAGNAGQERAEFEGDVGYVMGRVHSSGRVRARGLVNDLEWNVVGNGIADISENELEIWYPPQDRLAVSVKPPSEPWTKRVEPGQYIENLQLSDGSFVSVYNELYHPANGANYISVFLSPRLRENGVVGVQAGPWLVRLHGADIRDGSYHCWIERDDPRRVGKLGTRQAWVFPSFFSERSFVDDSTISSLACGQRVVAVANLNEPARRIAVTSSQGPTRDRREKPDIAAPGSGIVAANGFADGDSWIEMSGTSMASPFVAGVVGLMLAVNPRLTGAQIAGIIRRTANPLPGQDYAWRNDAGFGVIDAEACLQEARVMREREDVTK